ncbi:hypothetical protein LCGC14_0208470 [marine sediment metagenome]|uniref:Uncharacterized protein n=1 Tax=marine sediment metagenome TaxID=412755 RepID=A0A0F9X0R7_9ZZZZ
MKMYSVKYRIENAADDTDNERSLNLLAETFEDAFVLSKVRFPSMKILAISISDKFEVDVSIKDIKNEAV